MTIRSPTWTVRLISRRTCNSPNHLFIASICDRDLVGDAHLRTVQLALADILHELSPEPTAAKRRRRAIGQKPAVTKRITVRIAKPQPPFPYRCAVASLASPDRSTRGRLTGCSLSSFFSRLIE